MNSQPKKTELIAPAGEASGLKLAIYYGADAVYLGVEKFNARLSAGNFKLENLANWVEYCHLFRVKVYLTLNTIIKQDEFAEAVNVAVAAYNAGVDALIVTDLGLISFLRSNLPQMPLHFSTQLNIHNYLGIQAAAEIGAKAIVVSREATDSEIKLMNGFGVELEAFIQGALCVSLSGQCYLSSIADGNSGNRGLCKQPCRQPYRCTDSNGKEVADGYLLSPKDLCVLRGNRLNELISLGITKLKIEGRLRRPSYISQAVKSYRRILDEDNTALGHEIDALAVQFNRGNFTNGYGSDLSEMMNPEIQGHIGVFAGKAEKCDGNLFTVKSGKQLKPDDGFKLLRNGKEIGGANLVFSINNGVYRFKANCLVKQGDELRLTTDSAENLALTKVSPEIKVDMFFKAVAGQPSCLKMVCRNETVSVQGEIAVQAINQPLDEERICQQLKKLAEPFVAGEIIVEAENVFMPIALINQLRREGLRQLINKLAPNARAVEKIDFPLNDKIEKVSDSTKISKLTVLCVSEYVDLQKIEWQYVDFAVIKPFIYDKSIVAKMLRQIGLSKDRTLLHLPNFAGSADIEKIKSLVAEVVFGGVVADNLYGIMLGKECDLPVFAGLGLNIANDYALDFFNRICGVQPFALISKELTFDEINSISASNKCSFTFGDFCVMSVRHCPNQLNLKAKCDDCAPKPLLYTDGGGRKFKLFRRKISSCTWDVYNELQLSAGKGTGKIENHFIEYVLPDIGLNINGVLHACKENLSRTDMKSELNGKFTSGLLQRGIN